MKSKTNQIPQSFLAVVVYTWMGQWDMMEGRVDDDGRHEEPQDSKKLRMNRGNMYRREGSRRKEPCGGEKMWIYFVKRRVKRLRDATMAKLDVAGNRKPPFA